MARIVSKAPAQGGKTHRLLTGSWRYMGARQQIGRRTSRRSIRPGGRWIGGRFSPRCGQFPRQLRARRPWGEGGLFFCPGYLFALRSRKSSSSALKASGSVTLMAWAPHGATWRRAPSIARRAPRTSSRAPARRRARRRSESAGRSVARCGVASKASRAAMRRGGCRRPGSRPGRALPPARRARRSAPASRRDRGRSAGRAHRRPGPSCFSSASRMSKQRRCGRAPPPSH